jgi:hypothetical protein
MLAGRQGIIWHPLRRNIVKASRIVIACMKLHNFIIDLESLAVPGPSDIDAVSEATLEETYVIFQDEADIYHSSQRRRRAVESSKLQELFTEEIKDASLRRPSSG